MLGKSPKLGQQPKLAQPNFGWANFFHIWLGQSFAAGLVLAEPYFGWANFAGQVLWLGHFGWAYGWVIDWPIQKCCPAIIGPAKFFSLWLGHYWPCQNIGPFIGPFFDWAKNGCGWPGQMGFSPTLIINHE